MAANHNRVEVLSFIMDVSEEASAKSAISQTVNKFERIDIAINNAWIDGQPVPTDSVSLSDRQKVLATRVQGVYLCQRSQILQMLEQEPLSAASSSHRGIIVNVASMLGLDTPASAYTASKHGLIGLTKIDTVAYARQGIRINPPVLIMPPHRF